MIKNEGKIEVSSRAESEAVISKLKAKGVEKAAFEKYKKKHPFIYWREYYASECGTKDITFSESPNPLHTLADFNLLPGGEPMLTMKDIELKAKYEPRKDLTAGIKYGSLKATEDMVNMIGDTVTPECFYASSFDIEEDADWSWTPEMLQRRVTHAPTQPSFEFGDKVKVEGVYEPRIIALIEGDTALVFDTTRETPESRKSGAMTYGYPVSKLTPWPTPVTIQATDEYKATITKGSVKVGCQTVTIEKVREILSLHDEKFGA